MQIYSRRTFQETASQRKMQGNPIVDTKIIYSFRKGMYAMSNKFSANCETSGGKTSALRVRLACLLYITIPLVFPWLWKGF